ncbi:MAG TPA: HD domain-containing protein [Gemmatimonadota bacterium]|nr:HD domain-containing protein [Gemmatimonadota bacterium]
MARPRTVRDPLWGNVRLDARAAAVLDSPPFQRLRRVKQLGFAHLVYPGAVHTRFLHALGVHHLAGRALRVLEADGALDELGAEERELLPVLPLAALLHDVGHYAFSHAMEEIEPDSLPGHHEELAGRFLDAEPIRDVLEEVHPGATGLVADLIRGRSGHPLQGLIAGSLDLDKIDYLARDSFFCGVPYGAVDVDRLLDSLTLAREEPGAPLELAVTEKGITALESLLFSKYQMFRNVYWHHTVRAATALFRRLVESALEAGVLGPEELPGRTDEELLGTLLRRVEGDGGGGGADHLAGGPPARHLGPLVRALVDRDLPKRCAELFGDELPADPGTWLQERPDLARRLEARLGREWGLEDGVVLLDYPAYPAMLDLRLLLVRSRGEVRRLTSAGAEGILDLPRLSRALHHSARVFRIFTLPAVGPRDAWPILELLRAPAAEAEARLEDPAPLGA